MEKETRKIGFSCLLGAFIGGLISIEIANYFALGKYFWFIGALFGGAVSYLAYDLGQVKDGVVHGYRRAVAWRPDTKWWKVCLSEVVLFSVVIGVVVFSIAEVVAFGLLLPISHFVGKPITVSDMVLPIIYKIPLTTKADINIPHAMACRWLRSQATKRL